jgi:hypothetical protein
MQVCVLSQAWPRLVGRRSISNPHNSAPSLAVGLNTAYASTRILTKRKMRLQESGEAAEHLSLPAQKQRRSHGP